jgi:hypothetical protein
MRSALEAGGLSVIEQIKLPLAQAIQAGGGSVIGCDDFPLRLQNQESCFADGRLIAQFVLAEKKRT